MKPYAEEYVGLYFPINGNDNCIHGILTHEKFGAKFPFSYMEISYSGITFSCHDSFMYELFCKGNHSTFGADLTYNGVGER